MSTNLFKNTVNFKLNIICCFFIPTYKFGMHICYIIVHAIKKKSILHYYLFRIYISFSSFHKISK